ncbi:MAG: nicotinate (nicotinamide) nucleotide adenylyltransferase [Acidobacteria bacterium]|nr:nicotinate (nicotinamide) nucleotide adenylyltransferase [Acidobacteriota bacterium]
MTRRIGILGGTFDPIHSGHVDVGLSAQAALDLRRVFVVTANVPPHRPQPFASAYHRFAMAAIAVNGRDGWRSTDLELRVLTPSYTSETLKRFLERGYAATELFFVIGADAFLDIGSWRDYPSILDLANFAVVSRPGYPVDELSHRLPRLASRMVRPPGDSLAALDPMIFLIDAQTADVSSTAIRRRLAAGESIAGLVPAGVQQHIEQHGLYSAMPPGRRVSDPPQPPAAGGLHGQD